MDNYNSSSYYRANPYKDIGYMPPIAQKNRNQHGYGGQIPQGRDYFEHANKKHYGQAYRNEIVDDNIMKGVDQYTPLQKQAMQRSYFRSLNSKDIQGSTTNTLISKAVKNKQKAQQELQRRKQMQREQAQFLIAQKYQQEQNRKKYLQQFHRQVMMQRGQKPQELNQNNKIPHSYTNLPIKRISDDTNGDSEYDQKKKREAQLLRLAQQRKNYAVVDFSTLYNNKQTRNNLGNGSLIVEKKPNYHMQQKRRKTQRGTEIQSKLDREKQNQQIIYKNNGKYQREGSYYMQAQDHQDQKRGQANGYNLIQRDQMRKYENYNLPYQNLEPITQIKHNNGVNFQKQKYGNPYDQPKNYENYEDVNKYNKNSLYPQQFLRRDSKISQNSNYPAQIPIANYEVQNSGNVRVPQFKSREQLRRHNPTYLSYGSPTSFAMAASKNVIGY